MNRLGVAEYGWENSGATHAHSYLLPVVERALDDAARRNKLPAEGLQIFDAGCGNGYLAGYFLSKGHKVAGCDASEEGVNLARESFPQGVFEVASVYDNLAGKFGAHWDVVISTEVVEHLYDPRTYARNVSAMLRPGGMFIVTTPYHGYLRNLVLVLTGKMDSHFTALWDGGHIKFWSVKTLSALLSGAGFSVDAFYGAGRVPYIWKSMVLAAYKNA